MYLKGKVYRNEENEYPITKGEKYSAVCTPYGSLKINL